MAPAATEPVPGPLRGSLRRSSLLSAAVLASNAALGLAVSAILARLLGVDGFGVYVLALSVVMLATTPLQIGVANLAVRSVSAHRGGAIPGGLLTWTARLAAACALCATVLLAGASFFAAGPIGGMEGMLWIGVAILLLQPMTAARGGALRGIGHPVLGQIPDGVIRPGLMLAGSLALLGALPEEATPAMAMAAHAAASLGAFAAAQVFLRRATRDASPGIPAATIQDGAGPGPRRWLSAVLPLSAAAALQILNGSVGLLALGLLASNAEAGAFRVIVQLCMLVAFGLAAVIPIMQGRVARLHARGDSAGLQRAVAQATGLSVGLCIAPAAALLLSGGPFLALLLGETVPGGAVALSIYVLGQIANAAFGPAGMVLNMTGHERQALRGLAVAVTVNATACALLIPPLGLEGAALAGALSVLTWNALLWAEARRRVGIDSSAAASVRLAMAGWRAARDRKGCVG